MGRDCEPQRPERLGGLIHEYAQVALGGTVSGARTCPASCRLRWPIFMRPGQDTCVDWAAWHAAYDDPSSPLSARLRAVRSRLSDAVDQAPMASGRLTCSSSCPPNAEPHDPSGAAAEAARVGPWLSRRPNDRCPRAHRDPASDRGIASCCVYRRPPRPWVPAARLPGPRAACARAQGAVRAWRRGWSGERDAVVRRPLCRAG